jgi:hypothetical protein
MKNIPEFENFVNEGNVITADDQSYLDQIISFAKTKKYKNDKDFTDEILFQLRKKIGDREGLVKKRFEKIYRAVVADVNKGKFIPMDESVVNESATHFFRVKFYIEDGTYREPEEILKTNLWAAKAQHKIESYTYEFEGKEKGRHYADKDLVYMLKIFTNLTKQELKKYFDDNSVNAESYEIL